MADDPSLFTLIHEDYVANHRDWTRPGFRALVAYRIGAWSEGRGSGLEGKALRLVARLLYRYVRNTYGIELPATTIIGRRLVVEHQSAIVVHGCSKIGHDCILRQGVTLGNRSMVDPLSAPTLGNRVNIGAGAMILGAVRIGDDVRIGANAVVLTDVPSNSIVVPGAAYIKPLKSVALK